MASDRRSTQLHGPSAVHQDAEGVPSPSREPSPSSLAIVAGIARTLDGLGIAAYLLDQDDCTLLWNQTFLSFFPEHDGHIHRGEHYAENLRRYFEVSLGPGEKPFIDRYIAAALKRHREQRAPFVFSHHDLVLRVNSEPIAGLGRIRIWSKVSRIHTDDTLRALPSLSPGSLHQVFIENLADGMALLDSSGRITATNERFVGMYEAGSSESVKGRTFEEVFRTTWRSARMGEEHGETWRACADLLRERSRTPGAPFEVPLPRDRWVRIVEHLGHDGLTYSIHSDVTAMKRQEHAIQRAKEAADEANRAKSEFLARMSHELRTPLNAIIGYSDMIAHEIRGPVGTRDYIQYARDINESGQHLLGLIAEILDNAKAEAGRIVLYEQPIDLGNAIDFAMRMMEPRATRSRVALRREIELGMPRVLADERRMRQIILNLLSNAVKFTPSGGSAVVELRHDGEGICIAVVDTGAGIAERDISAVLQPFVQAGPVGSSRFEGTGLGLALTKHLVELHGGRLEIESALGEGTRVTVRLPSERIIGTSSAPE
jgi:two-component system sensor histidine kinase/response regulator